MASSSSSTILSPAASSLYDIFLSFSGIDTRNTFTSHLLSALEQQGFSTYRDDTKLVRGEDIGFQLPKAISESRVSIVVFSKNYAASGWCLDELVKIMECRRDFNQIVLPIFYDVDPVDVRRQVGFYSKAFEKHEQRTSMEKVKKWREALTQAANLFGWHLLDVVNGDEAKLIKVVVNEVISRIDKLYCDVADHPVGIDSRVQILKRLLNLKANDVSIVAVWGVGGIGKTTIAKAVFNSISNNFEGSSFLADVREITKVPSRVVDLQKQLLSDILRNDNYSFHNYHQGIELIKKKLCHCRVLLVLDDVDHVQQLKMLSINRDLFCAGSKIIITTRNKSVITSIQVDAIYTPDELNNSDSLKLFSWNAFKMDDPEEGYLEISQQVVDHAEGLPLALEVLGSFFSGRSKAEWESGLRKLQKHLPNDIQGKLKISFESLDKTDQDLFLDIAFFFIGRDKEFVVKLLEDTECFPVYGIGELAQRCLLRVDGLNKLTMHSLLREMAREIVYQESSKEPAKRSRLRGHEEVIQVLQDSVGRDAIEGLYLELPKLNNEEVDVAAFADMRNLRLLHLNDLCHLRGTNIMMSRKLKWICWRQFPLACIPDDVYMENIVAIDLQYSRLKQIWKGPKRLDKLRFLNLSYSCSLTTTPDFSGLKNLEELLLHDCTNLIEVHYSIGCLDKLIVLNMANCNNLRIVPYSICMLKSLQHLNLSGCSVLEQGEPGRIFSMFRRLVPYSQERVPMSVASIQSLCGLMKLNLAGCNLSNVPSEIGNLTLLKNLVLGGNKFSSIPTLSNLSHLYYFCLWNCHMLKHLPALPEKLAILDTSNCLSLESESVGTEIGAIREMICLGCSKLNYKKIERNIIRSLRDDTKTNLFLAGGELPHDMDFYGSGSRLSFVVPVMGHRIRGWIVVAVLHKEESHCAIVSYTVLNKTKNTEAYFSWSDSMCGAEDFLWVSCVGYLKNVQKRFLNLGKRFDLQGGDEIEIEFRFFKDEVKTGIRLIYEGHENAL